MIRKLASLVVIIAMALPAILAMAPVAGLPASPPSGVGLLEAEAGAGAELSGPLDLHMYVQTFDPLEEEFDLPNELRTTAFDGLFLVQFIGPFLPSWEERLEAMGCQMISSIPDHAFLLRMTAQARRTIVDLPFVRWVGPYHPGFRVYPELWLEPGPVVGISVLSTGDVDRTARALRAVGGVLEVVGTRVVQGWIPRAGMLALARDPSVEWMDPIIRPELHNDNSARLTGGRQGNDGPHDPSTLRLWSYDPVTKTFNGTTGEGYIVSAADTGLDDDHPSFIGHLPTRNFMGGSTTQDTYGHGTHCLGTITGTGLPYPADAPTIGDGKYIGVAPGATGYMQDIFEGLTIYRNFDELGRDATAKGAVVSSNSWGERSNGRYSTYDVIYDNMVRDAQPGVEGEQPIVYCFSAGNDGGRGDGSIATPASAKNVITVGATGNDKRGVANSVVAGFSSRGPCTDGRVKPDVVASGQHVVSAQAWPHTMPFDPPADGGQSWTYASGTSMSCPAVAGTVGLIFDWSENQWDHQDPSPALVKALLVNGADKLNTDPKYPGTKQGWGRVNLTKLPETPNYRTFQYDEETPLRFGGPKEGQRYIFAVEPGRRTVRFTLAWVDYTGSPEASKALVSDLDLIVTDPDGNVYRGNNFNVQGYSLSGNETINDTVNNVEKVVVPQAKEGFWAVEVRARDTPQGSQRYALVCQGDLRDQWRDLVAANVSLSKSEVDEGEGLTFKGEIVAMGTLTIPAFEYEMFVEENGTGVRTVFDSGTVTGMFPWESKKFSYRWTAVRGDWRFVLHIDVKGVVKEFTKLNNRVEIPMFVKGYGLAADMIPRNVTVWPSLDAYLELAVINKGNVFDTFTLSTEGIPVGWMVRLDDTEIGLQPQKTGTLKLLVRPPPAAKAEEVYFMYITVTSQGNSTYSQELETVATVGQVYGLDAEMAMAQTSVKPGLTVVHLINITNTGNGMDTYEMYVQGVPSGWSASFSEEEVTIEDNVTKVVRLEMGTPEKVISGTIADLDITVVSLSPKGHLDKVSARTRVTQYTGMDAFLSAERFVMPGGKVDFKVDILNLGNGPDDFFYAQVTPPSWSTSFPLFGNIEGTSLDAFESWSSNGTWACPRGARAGTYTFTVQVSTREFLKEMSVEVEVGEVFDMSKVLLCSGSAVYPGNSTRYCLSVTSLCNLPTMFTLNLMGAPDDWQVILDPPSTQLDPGRKVLFNLTMTPPKTTPSDLYNLRMVLDYGPRTIEENITLFVIDRPGEDEIGNGDGGSPLEDLLGSAWNWIALVLLVVVIVLLVALGLRRRSSPVELPFEEAPAPTDQYPGGYGEAFDEGYEEGYEEGYGYERGLPPPPPPVASSAPRRRPPPPPPPKQPESVEDLLAGTQVMHRESRMADVRSADRDYASGLTLARESQPTFVGDCPRCGGRVMEYASGTLMCSSCGAQFTD